MGQGKRSDLVELADAIVGGATMDDIVDRFPHKILTNDRGIKALFDAKRKHRSRHVPPQVVCYFGPPGIGKTTQVYEWANEKGFTDEQVFSHDGGKWFDGYIGQPICFIDEVDKCISDMGFQRFLKITDKFPASVEYKGGTCKFNSPIIFLCASSAPEDWLWQVNTVGNTKHQIERRINECYTRNAYGEPWVPVPMWKPSIGTVIPPGTDEEVLHVLRGLELGSQNYFIDEQ